MAIQKGVALRLRRICSSSDEYSLKSKEYMAYLVARGHSAEKVKSVFDNILAIPRKEARKKVIRSVNKNNIIFVANYNPRGPECR